MRSATEASALAARLSRTGAAVIRYGLSLILVSIGVTKFAAYEAEAIQPLVANSPLLSWLYELLSGSAVSAVFGVVEIALGVLIASWRFAPRLSALASVGAIAMFLITLSFLLTTPGVWQAGYGFPLLSSAGSFLVKDVVLLGAAVATAGEALARAGTRPARRDDLTVGAP